MNVFSCEVSWSVTSVFASGLLLDVGGVIDRVNLRWVLYVGCGWSVALVFGDVTKLCDDGNAELTYLNVVVKISVTRLFLGTCCVSLFFADTTYLFCFLIYFVAFLHFFIFIFIFIFLRYFRFFSL